MTKRTGKRIAAFAMALVLGVTAFAGTKPVSVQAAELATPLTGDGKITELNHLVELVGDEYGEWLADFQKYEDSIYTVNDPDVWMSVMTHVVDESHRAQPIDNLPFTVDATGLPTEYTQLIVAKGKNNAGETEYIFYSCNEGTIGTDQASAFVVKEANLFEHANKVYVALPSKTEDLTDGSSVSIPVLAFTGDATVYSVDVEWGAMTFQYVTGTWDPDTLTGSNTAHWEIYDPAANAPLGEATRENAINSIKIKNCSNAAVEATLAYAQEGTAYGVDAGNFTRTDESGTVGSVTYENDNKTITLPTANNGGASAGTAPVGEVFFMPTAEPTASSLPSQASRWAVIGKITVAIAADE